ncbi:hypothetical protein D3C72_2542370 [compost metagenome]
MLKNCGYIKQDIRFADVTINTVRIDESGNLLIGGASDTDDKGVLLVLTNK